MSTFTHTPLDKTDFDILSDPESANVLKPILGIKKSLFFQPREDVFITEGPIVDKVNKILDDYFLRFQYQD